MAAIAKLEGQQGKVEGRVVQVIGPVVDVEFPEGKLPGGAETVVMPSTGIENVSASQL